MREIKFRVWDGEEMLDHQNLCCPSTSLGEILNGELKVMQYSGIKDKTDKEIYEEDIAKDKNGILWKIKFVAPSFIAVWLKPDGSYHSHEFVFWRSEIIGNIYENPELFEEGK